MSFSFGRVRVFGLFDFLLSPMSSLEILCIGIRPQYKPFYYVKQRWEFSILFEKMTGWLVPSSG
jgi:hypothetical protein